MSFYPQPSDYQCGPFALKYALVMLGVFLDEDKIGITAGSTWWAGTDEIGLAKAAKEYKCKMKYFTEYSSKKAFALLNRELKKGHPCLLSVKNWEHWATVVSFSKGKYILLDSENKKVISIFTPNQLSKFWEYYYDEEDYYSFDGYAIVPKFKVNSRAKLTLDEAKQVLYKKNEMMALKWDQYFNDLISICKTRVKYKNRAEFLTFSQFRKKNGKLLIRQVADWHGEPSYKELEIVLQNLNFIANVYDLIIPLNLEKKAIIDLTSILMLYSCGKYGMDPVY